MAPSLQPTIAAAGISRKSKVATTSCAKTRLQFLLRAEQTADLDFVRRDLPRAPGTVAMEFDEPILRLAPVAGVRHGAIRLLTSDGCGIPFIAKHAVCVGFGFSVRSKHRRKARAFAALRNGR